MTALRPPLPLWMRFFTSRRIIVTAALTFLLVVLLVLSGCEDPNGARDTADAYGFTNIKVTGHAWSGCDEKDTYATAIEADNMRGDRVSGIVCSGGWMGKGGTLRVTGIVRRAAVDPQMTPDYVNR